MGKGNIARFMFFIAFLLGSLGLIGSVSILAFVSLLGGIQIEGFMEFREATKTQVQKFEKLGLLAINIAISSFFFPVFLLLCVQIKNLLINKTTYERIRGGNESVKEQLKGRNKKGASLSNCRAMCSNTRGSFMSDQSEQSSILDEQLIDH